MTCAAMASWCSQHVTEPSTGAWSPDGVTWTPGCGGGLDWHRAAGDDVRTWSGPERLAVAFVLAIHAELDSAPVLEPMSDGDRAEVFIAAATAAADCLTHCTRRPHGAGPDGTVDHWHLAAPLDVDDEVAA